MQRYVSSKIKFVHQKYWYKIKLAYLSNFFLKTLNDAIINFLLNYHWTIKTYIHKRFKAFILLYCSEYCDYRSYASALFML